MAQTTTHQADTEEDPSFIAEIARMSADADRLLIEMKQSQEEIDRLHEGNTARLTKIEAALDRLLST